MAIESSRLMERAMGIEIIATWFFKDLRSRARTDLEGLGSLRNPYHRIWSSSSAFGCCAFADTAYTMTKIQAKRNFRLG